MTNQYNPQSQRYASFVHTDRSKQYGQFYSIAHLLGRVRGQRLLDLGCGSGDLARMLGHGGATIIGIDSAPQMIAQAKQLTTTKDGEITFRVADASRFTFRTRFDVAYSVMVLPYLTDEAELRGAFSAVYRSLPRGGRFLSVVFNPEFHSFAQSYYGRTFSKGPGRNRARVQFQDATGHTQAAAVFCPYPKAAYERAARRAGFSSWHWENIVINPKAMKKYGRAYWYKYLADCAYLIFVATK